MTWTFQTSSKLFKHFPKSLSVSTSEGETSNYITFTHPSTFHVHDEHMMMTIRKTTYLMIIDHPHQSNHNSTDNLFQMKLVPEWQASYQTMGSLRFPFYHKLSFSSLQIYLFQRQKYLFVFFHLSKYLFYLMISFSSIQIFRFHRCEYLMLSFHH